jgi:hypothetical protein
MPQFQSLEDLVAYKVTRQTLTTGDVNEYQVVDRFLEHSGSKIVARFDDDAESIAFRDKLREQRVADVQAGRVKVN